MSQEAKKKHGVFSWNELMTTDVKSAQAFYGELLDWSLKPFDSDEMQYTIAKVGDQEVAGMMTMPPGSEGMTPAWRLPH